LDHFWMLRMRRSDRRFPRGAIHSAIHDVVAAAHTAHGKAFSTLGKLLDPLPRIPEFYQSHALFDDFTASAEALGNEQGGDPEEPWPADGGPDGRGRGLALQWTIARAQLLAEAAGTPQLIRPEIAELTATQIGNEKILNFYPLWDKITSEEPDLLT
jgi:hypothetical protein